MSQEISTQIGAKHVGQASCACNLEVEESLAAGRKLIMRNKWRDSMAMLRALAAKNCINATLLIDIDARGSSSYY